MIVLLGGFERLLLNTQQKNDFRIADDSSFSTSEPTKACLKAVEYITTHVRALWCLWMAVEVLLLMLGACWDCSTMRWCYHSMATTSRPS